MQRFAIKRAYDQASKDDGYRVLVDRIWPRGISKKDAAIDRWAKELAPSTGLRKWFDHDPEKWDEFQQRYHKELEGCEAALDDLAEKAKDGLVTLVYGAKDTKHNQAVVLQNILNKK